MAILGEERDQSKSVAEAAWVLEVIDTYVAHLRTGAPERRAFAEAACVYRARHPDTSDEAARRAVAEIISHKL
jgi:hypothetical protein